MPVQICVPVCEGTFAEMRRAALRAAEIGDLVELRLDYLESDELRDNRDKINELVSELRRPTILTWRPREQGGQRELDRAERAEFWLSGNRAQFLDIEVDLTSVFATNEFRRQFDWGQIICSHHDFAGVPDNLRQIYEQMVATPSRILKLAVNADDVTDCIPLFDLIDRARADGREIIAVGMGNAGIATRILGPSRGAFLTYGAMERENATAPGQLTAAELMELYRVCEIDSRTQITGLVGRPVSHSVSPHIHNSGFRSAGLNAVYIPFEVKNVTAFLQRMVRPKTRELEWNVRGLSVTAPHKSSVVHQLDWIAPAAREIGAVNTIVVEGDELHGYNTDGTAFIRTLIEKYGQVQDAHCALIGAGGAARSTLSSLRKEGAEVTVFARDQKKAELLANDFGAQVRSLHNSTFKEFDVVINASPLGTKGESQDETPAVATQLRGTRLAYDLVYNPLETRFMREAREAGCETLGGLAMLVSQAAEQFKLWTGVDAPLAVMRDAATLALTHE